MTRLFNFNILLLSMIFCGWIALNLGKDLDWDLANYHLSNVFLFLYHKPHQDVWPASYFHIHFAPTADFINYFLITYCMPKVATFVMGAIHGINLWLLFHIARLFLSRQKYSLFLSIVLALLGMCGAVGYYSIGNFKNDQLIVIFVLVYVFAQLKVLLQYNDEDSSMPNWQFLAGFSLGIAIGLKYTAIIYEMAAIITLFFLPLTLRIKYKLILLLMVSSFIGFLLTAGYWLLYQWQEFHNPFFPFFFNHFFHTPELPANGWYYPAYAAKSFLEKLTYPIYLGLYGTYEGDFFDLRYLCLYFLIIMTGISLLIRRIHKKKSTFDLISSWLLLFITLSYFIFQFHFAALRYLLLIEMLAPLLIYILLVYLIPQRILRAVLLCFLFSAMIFTVQPQIHGMRKKWYGNDYFHITIPPTVNTVSEATVLMAYSDYAIYADPRPSQYLISYFPKKWHFIGIPFAHQLYDISDNKSRSEMTKQINEFNGRFFLITDLFNIAQLYEAALNFNLIPIGPCEEIPNDRSRSVKTQTLLCPVSKLLTV